MLTSGEGIAVEWLASLDGLPAHERAALDAPHIALFDSLAWTADFSATALADGAAPVWLSVRSADAALLLPLQRERRAVGPLRVATLGALANYYTMRWQPLALRRQRACGPAAVDEPLWQAAAAALARSGAALARLAPLAAEAAWVEPLARALARQSCTLRREPAFGNWVAHVAGARFDDWFERRPAALRNTWRRRSRQLERRARVAFELHGAPTGQGPAAPARALDDAIAAYESVYARSWKEPEPHAAFIPTLMRRAAARGALRLGLLFADDAPIAAQLWLRDGAATVIYKLAYDQDWKACSPGLALSVEMFRHAIDVDRVALVDYGSGDDAYKRDWMDERLERVALTAYCRRHPVGALLAWRQRLRRERA